MPGGTAVKPPCRHHAFATPVTGSTLAGVAVSVNHEIPILRKVSIFPDTRLDSRVLLIIQVFFGSSLFNLL
jgi:hypothetical protein